MLHAARPPAAAARPPQTRARQLRSSRGAPARASASAPAAAAGAAASGAPRAPPRLILLRHGQAAEEPSLQVRSHAPQQRRKEQRRTRARRCNDAAR
jgi:hypothetical protein